MLGLVSVNIRNGCILKLGSVLIGQAIGRLVWRGRQESNPLFKRRILWPTTVINPLKTLKV